MKIGVVVSEFHPNRLDAVGRSVWEISKRLGKKRHKITIITSGETDKKNHSAVRSLKKHEKPDAKSFSWQRCERMVLQNFGEPS